MDKDQIKARATNLATIQYGASSAGFISGLIFAYKRGSHFWGYVGWGILGGLVIGGVVGIISLPAAAKIKNDADKAGVSLN